MYVKKLILALLSVSQRYTHSVKLKYFAKKFLIILRIFPFASIFRKGLHLMVAVDSLLVTAYIHTHSGTTTYVVYWVMFCGSGGVVYKGK